MSGSMIRACKCKNDFQDERYGSGQRVHSKCLKGWRCSVCGNEIQAVHATTETAEKKKK
jgi:hypothetical protein